MTRGPQFRRSMGAVTMVSAVVMGLTACGTRVSDDRLIAAGNRTLAGGTVVQGEGPTITGGASGLEGGSGTGVPSGTTATGGSTGTAGTGGSATNTSGTTGAAPTKPLAGGRTGVGPSAAPGAAAQAACSSSLAPVVIGQVGTFSGFLAPNLGGFRPGLAAWAAAVNAKGGLQCHPVQLLQRDDQANGSKTVSQTKDLLENQHAVAMVASPVPFTLSPYRSVTGPAKIPTIGGDSIGLEWSTDQYMYPTGVGFFNGGIAGGLESVKSRTGKKKFGLIYCVEAQPCTQAKATWDASVKAAGGVSVSTQSVSLTQTDYTSACQNLKNAGAEVVETLVDASAMVRIFRSCASIGYKPLGSTVGLGVAPVSIEDKNVGEATVTVAAATVPYFDDFVPAVAEYQAAMQRYAPGVELDYASISAWTSGKMLERGLALVASQARSGPITTKMILQGMGKIKNETFGGLFPAPVTWTEGKAHGVPPCFFTTVIQGGKIVDPTHGKPSCTG